MADNRESLEGKLAEKLGFRIEGCDKYDTALWNECLRLMAEQEWVRVEDRLPRLRERVICACKDGTVQQGERDVWFDSAVMFWKPMPKHPGSLPKGEKE